MATDGQHADATRQEHIRDLADEPRTYAFAGIAIVLAAVAGFFIAGVIGATAGALIALLVALGVAWTVADAKAEEDFFATYAKERSLQVGGAGGIPASTSLLRQGVRRYVQRAFAGTLPGGLNGMLALYTYETESRDSKGNKQTQYHKFTVVLAELPEADGFIGHLHCQRRAGFKFLDSVQDAFGTRQRVETESAALDESHEIFIGQADDPNRARQLLSPSFVDWLASSGGAVAFEFEQRWLLCTLPGHQGNAGVLDGLCENATRVAERISTEARESATAPPTPAKFDPRGALAPVAADAASKRVRRRVITVVGIVVVLGIVLGSRAITDDVSDSAVESSQTPSNAANTTELSKQDEDFLALLAKLDKGGQGPLVPDFAEHGYSQTEASELLGSMSAQGLATADAQGWHLTPAGEVALEG